MLNVEKYLGVIKREIDENACASKSCLIAKVRRGVVKQDCDRTTCRDCEDESIEWIFSEYKPPLLENGDVLKPGDWIMVRDVDSQSFVKRQFLYFFDGKFICSAPNHAPLEGFGEPWAQAHLPEDGE